MRLLLTGATGFVGRELVPSLEVAGHDLVLVSRDGKRAQRMAPRADVVEADPSQPGPWQELTGRVEGVINLAGEAIAEKRWTPAQLLQLRNSRIDTTRHLVEALEAAARKPAVFISGSAIGYYGSSSSTCFDEQSPPGEDVLGQLCRDWEAAALPAERFTRLVRLRLGIVLGPDGGALGRMIPMFRLGLGGPIGSGQQWMSWIHRTDLCRLIVTALEDGAYEGVYNAVAPNPVSMATMATALGKAMGRPSLLPLPAPVLQMLLGDGAKVVLEGQQVMPRHLNQQGFAFRYPQLDAALAAVLHG
ncbi:MAG: TIGR01777 family protein [Aphanocapsa feldmannii 277cV]|uniref:TIGR01777 family protein n=2 Tax=Aphanocapsa feldmannii TaxID=192050 RepID=A0A524RNR7_9CHRO|nr:MAG: TIGR01777 family protein [Aphanocapsa feldmannii 288cV]TGG92694.1 MAG: TIGR01777 family protein [Aphanocapsa feldmannii 277cV]TGH20956.1 MAG: TIGR01777 family protein [Aphanocapsa feldmannii 277cI]